MKNIQGIKLGNMVNLSIEGKLYKKNCGSAKEADELFRLVLKAKEDPTPENVRNIRAFLNEKLRIAYLTGLESDVETGQVFLAGFNTPVPETLLEVIKEYHENGYPMDAVINFWKLLMINPDVRVRTSLFDFIKTHDFVLTDKGYMVVYKAVYLKEDEVLNAEQKYIEFLSNKYLHVKKTWKEKPDNYVVYKDLATGEFALTKVKTAEGWDEKEKNIEFLGKLGTLHNTIMNGEKTGRENTIVYTDMYSKKMHIELGVPVRQERKLCDADPAQDCSNGLHCGATKYVENYANHTSAILACFVNPTNVVAVPNYDKSKMRTCEYFPFAVATFDSNIKKIDIIEQMYFEEDYCDYETAELEKQIAKVKANELPIETAKKAEKESRPMPELMKMLEGRMLDIS
jgi:hypothetical protein